MVIASRGLAIAVGAVDNSAVAVGTTICSEVAFVCHFLGEIGVAERFHEGVG